MAVLGCLLGFTTSQVAQEDNVPVIIPNNQEAPLVPVNLNGQGGQEGARNQNNDLFLEDGCIPIAGRRVVTYNQALACYDSFGLRDGIRESTLTSIRRTLDFYAFKDIIKVVNQRFNPNVIDLDAGLLEIEGNNYNTERAFQVDLMSLINRVKDGHLKYNSNCFRKFYFNQPFSLVVVRDGDGEKVIVNQVTSDNDIIRAYNGLDPPIDVNQFRGFTVSRINGVIATEFIKTYADKHSTRSRDKDTRYNDVLSRSVYNSGRWETKHGSFQATRIIPDDEFLTYEFIERLNQPIIIPYLATIETPVVDSQAYYQRYCVPGELVANNNDADQEINQNEQQQPAPIGNRPRTNCQQY